MAAPTISTSLTELQQAQLSALVEEYRAMYSLVLFRLAALDRRVPVAGAAAAGFLASVGALPWESRLVVLVGVPAAMVWLLRVTMNHARSFEDALRRIETVERAVNELLGKSVLSFQSQHPSGGRMVGGRTGGESVRAVLMASLLLVAACGYFFYRTGAWSRAALLLYGGYTGVAVAYLVICMVRLARYRYEPRSPVGRT